MGVWLAGITPAEMSSQWKNTFLVLLSSQKLCGLQHWMIFQLFLIFLRKQVLMGFVSPYQLLSPPCLSWKMDFFLVSDPKARRKCYSLLPALHILREGMLLQLVQIPPNIASKPKITKEKKK